MKEQAFTINGKGLLRVLETDIMYGIPFLSPEDEQNPSTVTSRGVWDTGASESVISHEVVQKLGLYPISQQRVLHAQGESIVNVYKVNVYLPSHILVENVRVTEGSFNLIGMDIITLGDFAITNRDFKTMCSFQIPSTHQYDFVKQIQNGKEQKTGKKRK